ncbi:hypothetical protein WG8_2001 [Paenibacillus sp. Aloe-11]|nr:hypothetical protein WG8_2001 [Paenibacillus sp. Aloe-11]
MEDVLQSPSLSGSGLELGLLLLEVVEIYIVEIYNESNGSVDVGYIFLYIKKITESRVKNRW